ncbi:ABC transporter ATP-binding protein [Paenibacillus tundrae]|nr:ABC transporter ATP-binding protein [Paenibacillus tundrae]
MKPLLDIRNLSVTYQSGSAALQDLSFTMKPGEIVGIVGESGSGKSTLLRAILGMLPDGGQCTSGEVFFQGKSILSYSPAEWGQIRGKRIAIVFQASGSYLNPIRKVGSQYIEAIRAHFTISKKTAYDMALNMLSGMGLHDPQQIMNAYPNQLSGGMKQRTAIAMAVTMEPELLLTDEPTSALDVTTQLEVLKRLHELRDRKGTGIIMVTHNMAVAAHMADQIGVMQHGTLVEYEKAAKLITNPREEYTRQLLQAVPELDLGGQ